MCSLRKLVVPVILLAGVVAVPPQSLGVTTVKQPISKNTVWTAKRGPYVLPGDLLVQKGATLKIEPGVRVEVDPEKTIEVQGKLVAIGTPEKPITFTAHADKPWAILCFTDFSDDATYSQDGRYLDGCILDNCIIEKSNGIFIRFGCPFITNCDIRNNVSSGIRVEFGGPRIVKNRIYGNSTETETASGNGAGIIAYTDKDVLIADNVIHDNVSVGGRDGGGGIYAYSADSGQITIRNNVLFGNTSSRFGGGIYAYKSIISDNTVMGNSAAKRGGGIYVVESNVHDNLVQSNVAESAAGIFAENSEIASNSILRNIAKTPAGGGLYYFGTGDILHNCIAANLADGEDACGGVYVSGNPTFHENNIFNNAGYALYVANVATAPDVMATENFWGASSDKAILERTFDWFDNEAAGLAICTPYLSQISPNAPAPPPLNLVATSTKNGVELSWDEPQGAAFAGHRVYYGTGSGYPYDSVAQTGPEKTFTVKGLKPGTEYSFVVSGYRLVSGKEVQSGISEEVRLLFTGVDELLAAPKNVTPADSESDTSRFLILKATSPDAGADVVASRWQVAVTPGDFTSLTIDLVTTAEKLSELNLTRDGLTGGREYRWRVSYRKANGSWSPWSQPTSFATIADSPSIISGPISTAVKLEKRYSPYQVVGNTLIMPTGTLTAEPGVQVRFAAGKNLMVRGNLVARGTQSEPIPFTRSSPAGWGSIIFSKTSASAEVDANRNYVAGNVLERCTVEYGKGIIIESSSPLIKDCEISNNKGSGIVVRQGGPLIVGNNIHHNEAPTNGGGIYAYTNDIINVISNKIHDNRADGDGGGIFAYGYMNTSTIHAGNNDIVSNEATGNGGGICLSRSSAVNNRVESNIAGGQGGGIFTTFGLVNENRVTGNSAAQGGGVFAECNSSIKGNYVASNKAKSGLGGGVYINFWGTSIENEEFTGNTVTGNSAGPQENNGGVYVVGYLVFEKNNIYKNNGSQLYNGNESESSPLVVSQCYWGTADQNAISKQIVDARMDPKLGKVTFEPFSPEPLKFD